MTIKTKSELNALWVTGYCPSQTDYSNLFDSTIGVITSDDAIRANEYTAATFNAANGVWGCHSVDLSLGKTADSHTSQGVRSGLLAGQNNTTCGDGSVILGGNDNINLNDAARSSIVGGSSNSIDLPCSTIIGSTNSCICETNVSSCSLGANFIAGSQYTVVDGTLSSVISSCYGGAKTGACISSIIASCTGRIEAQNCSQPGQQFGNAVIGVKESNTWASCTTVQIATSNSDIYYSENSFIAGSADSTLQGCAVSVLSSKLSCSCGCFSSVHSSYTGCINANNSTIISSNGSAITASNFSTILASDLSTMCCGCCYNAIIGSQMTCITNANSSVIVASCLGRVTEEAGFIQYTLSTGKSVWPFMANSFNIGSCYDNTVFNYGGVQSGMVNSYSGSITDAYSRLYVNYTLTCGIFIPAECNDATQMMLFGVVSVLQSNGAIGSFNACALVKRVGGTVSILSQTVSLIHRECTGMCACFDTNTTDAVFLNVKSHTAETGIAHAFMNYQLLRN